MGKKKSGKKGTAPELSKKDRKKLERREAELQARLDAMKASKKSGKKGKGKKAGKKAKGADPAQSPIVAPMTAAERNAVAPKPEQHLDETNPYTGVAQGELNAVLAAADKVLADPASDDKARDRARKTRDRVLAELDNDGLKARVEAKKARRAALEATRDEVDRGDADAVRAWNLEYADLGGSSYITSDAEREGAKKPKKGSIAAIPGQVMAEAEARVEAAYDALEDAARADLATDVAVIEPPVVEKVETEQGTVFAAGAAALSDVDEKAKAARAKLDANLVKPSDVQGPPDFETNGRGQYKVKRLSDGKVVGFTRVTTYIDVLEHKGQLEAWKLRMLLEGVAGLEVAETPQHVLVEVRDIMHARDVAIAKAHKADRKGKLEVGQLASLVKAANDAAKKRLDPLAEQAIDAAGAHAKREKGTSLHSLFEVADEHGIEAVEKMHADDPEAVTPADIADCRAYLGALEAHGLRIVDREVVVVNDELNVAGRLDRIVLWKQPGAQRATRVVADIKTGRVDYSQGKIAQQIEAYARGVQYDLETHERKSHGASKAIGLLIHVQAGSGVATVSPVDLTLGKKGNRLAGEVRAWRTEGRKAIGDPLTVEAPAAETAEAVA